MTENLIDGPITRTLPRFALPILYAGVAGWLSVSINTIWVGRLLGETGLAAAANANLLVFQLIGVAFGITNGAAVLIGRYLGAGDTRAAKRMVGTSICFFGLLSLIFLTIGVLFTRPLLLALNTPIEALPQAIAYARVMFLAVPNIYLFGFMMAGVRGSGDSKTPARFTYLVVAIDIALNPLFILGAGPLPPLGIKGSALASVCANAIGLLTLWYYLHRRNHPLILHRKEWPLLRMDRRLVASLLRQGLPMSGGFLVYSLSASTMMSLVNQFGVEISAAYGAAIQLWNYLQMPIAALGAGVSIMAAQNIGAQRWDRVETIVRVGVLYGVLSSAAAVAVSNLLSGPIFGLFFPPNASAIALARHINFIVSPGFILFGIVEVFFGVLRAVGVVRIPLLIMMAALFGVRIPVASMLIGSFGADAIWWSFPILSVVAAILAMTVYRYGSWRRMRMQQQSVASTG